MKRELTFEDWKFCAVVDLGIKAIAEEQQIQFNEHIIRIFKPTDKVVRNYHIAEVYVLKSKYPDNETAFHNCLDILNKILARISIAVFRPCRIITPISVTQFKAKKDEPFTMLLPANFAECPNSKNFDTKNNLELFYDINQQELNDSISELSLAINSSSIYSKFLHYYNCIERISHFLTTENIKHICKKCGELNELSVKATGNKMRDLFKICGYENKVFIMCRSIRGKLAHGSSERKRQLNLEIFEYLPIIEKVALNVLQENTSIKILDGEIMSQLNDQFIEVIGKKLWNNNVMTNAAYNIVSHNIKFNFKLNVIGKSEQKRGFVTENLVPILNRQIKVFPYAWPY